MVTDSDVGDLEDLSVADMAELLRDYRRLATQINNEEV